MRKWKRCGKYHIGTIRHMENCQMVIAIWSNCLIVNLQSSCLNLVSVISEQPVDLGIDLIDHAAQVFGVMNEISFVNVNNQ